MLNCACSFELIQRTLDLPFANLKYSDMVKNSARGK